jgi:hypothetical protein
METAGTLNTNSALRRFDLQLRGTSIERVILCSVENINATIAWHY